MKTLPKIMSGILVFAVFFATAFCCEPAKAATCPLPLKIEKAKSGCCNKAQPAQKQEKSCCREKLQAITQNQVSLEIYIPQLLLGSSLEILHPQVALLTAGFPTANIDGPPEPVLEPPLYILSHSFRI